MSTGSMYIYSSIFGNIFVKAKTNTIAVEQAMNGIHQIYGFTVAATRPTAAPIAIILENVVSFIRYLHLPELQNSVRNHPTVHSSKTA